MKAIDWMRYMAMKEAINRVVDLADHAPDRDSEERLRTVAADIHDAMVKEGMLKPGAEDLQ